MLCVPTAHKAPPAAPEGFKLCPNWTPGTSRPQDLEEPVTAQPVHLTHKPLSPRQDRGANLTPFTLSTALTAECPDPRSSPSSPQPPSHPGRDHVLDKPELNNNLLECLRLSFSLGKRPPLADSLEAPPRKSCLRPTVFTYLFNFPIFL